MSFVLELEYKPNIQLYKRVANALRKAIIDGRLAPGAPLPSIRVLSESLKISRATVLKALDEMYAEGLVESIPGSGTFVSRQLPAELLDDRKNWFAAEGGSNIENLVPIKLSAYGQRISSQKCFPDQFSDQVPVPTSVDATQLARWRKLLIKYCKDDHSSVPMEPGGYTPLREALARYLQRTRMVRCSSERIIVFGTKQGRLDMIARLLINPGDLVAVENPGYPMARHVFESYGARLLPVPVDSDGIRVDELQKLKGIKFLYVTPSHQDPTGATLSLDRRRILIDWAARNNCFIVEDDYDCEFRYGTKLLPSLQSIDTADRVIYISSLWKIFNPVCRVGYVVVPECLKEIFHLAKMQTERNLPIAEQIALADFLDSGNLEVSLRRCQISYSVDRQRLILALTRHLKDYLELNSVSAGTHIVGRFSCDWTEAQLMQFAQAVGLEIQSTAPYYLCEAVACEFMIQFVVPDSQLFESKVQEFARCLNESKNRGTMLYAVGE